MLDHILMFLRAQEQTKTTLEVLCKNHKNNQKYDITNKNMSIPLYLIIKFITPASHYTQHDIRD